MMIKTTTGKENFDGAMTTVVVTVMPSAAFPGGEAHISDAAKNPGPVRQIGTTRFVPAGSGLKHQLVGAWISGDYDVPEGMVFKVLVVSSRRGFRRVGAMLLQTRSGAANVEYPIALSGHRLASLSTVTIEGRFDLLSPAEAAREGVPVGHALHTQLVAAREAGMFIPRILNAETSKKPKVTKVATQNTDGEEVVLAIKKPLRMIDV